MKNKSKHKKIPTERNEFVAGMRFRKSGAHGKTKKAIRRSDKVRFNKEPLDQIAGLV